MPMSGPTGRARLIADLEDELPRAEADLRTLRGARLFITGGTGFVGTWLLESLVQANARLDLRACAVVLTRDPAAFAARAPHLAGAPGVSLIAGDVRASPANLGAFDGVIHAATPADAALNAERPLEMLETILAGGRATLELAAACGSIPYLFTSSGAVYGRQPAHLPRLPETYGGAPDVFHPAAAYAEGKRLGELQCALYARTRGVRAKIARLFAFVGPYLPHDRHFAVGNFLGDLLARRPIVVAGDGTTVRSYQYAAEMTTWLWAIYARAEPLEPINVGGDEAVAIGDLARAVAAIGSPPPPVTIRGTAMPGRAADRYVPDVTRAHERLGLTNAVRLPEALARTIAFAADA